MKKIKNKSLWGICFIITGVLLLLVNFYSKAEDANLEKRSITTFLETNDPEYRLVKKYSNKKYNKADVIHYIALLYIPKINLKQGLVSQSSPLNNVDSNIEILSPSKMPNEKNSTLVLASHSGNSKVSYFDKIDELTYGDLIYIYYQKKKYTYKITTFYEEPKQGFISIKYYNKKNKIVLTTCKNDNSDKQLIYIGELT